jgi:hypothetical protein
MSGKAGTSMGFMGFLHSFLSTQMSLGTFLVKSTATLVSTTPDL